ncbi:LytR C-terminal domain-containing protein [Streptomyces niveiscabiei]|uniref:LytR C-terminal domain-containing protein n=1 Tax=Streptomyces niveiscabiei TaxID=164115 RepID=UPI0029B578F1|nr:LytR C-terminal domain-containing protein [Streptomyces niveiscabiei]MDX3385445.1 LytR C-terminal domain-containing protein [Streptomyces niveiscabiei]
MGGEYRITGDKYPRMRRSRRRGRLVVVVVACGAVLGVAGWGTMQLVDVFTGGGGTASAASGTCAPKKAVPTTAAVVLPQPAQITVNVFNATTRSGLAKTTADELKKRGFKVGQVGNAPAQFDKKVAGTGVLVGVPAASGTSLSVLGVQLPGAARKMDAARKDASVDLIIGNGFRALAAPADATKALAALSVPKAAAITGTKKGC